MRITLSRQAEEFLEQQVRAGRFGSADEALEKAVELLMGRDRELQEMRGAIAESKGQIEAGDVVPLSQVTVASIRAGAQRRFGDPSKRKLRE